MIYFKVVVESFELLVRNIKMGVVQIKYFYALLCRSFLVFFFFSNLGVGIPSGSPEMTSNSLVNVY